MTMINWAKREVEIAKKLERDNAQEDEFEYGCGCYDSALKAYECLCNDEHSGLSICFTRDILNRLIDGVPLSPIDDVPEIWCDFTRTDSSKQGYFKTYQCTRMSRLFKHVYPDGRVTYTDVGRYYCRPVNNANATYSDGLMCKILDELYPITMPYYPQRKNYVIVTDELLTDSKNGDYDSTAVLEIINPAGISTPVNRYFKEEDRTWVEITRDEWYQRYEMHLLRMTKDSTERGKRHD